MAIIVASCMTNRPSTKTSIANQNSLTVVLPLGSRPLDSLLNHRMSRTSVADRCTISQNG